MTHPTTHKPKIELVRQDGSKKFEVGVYNQIVRDAVNTMDNVKDLDPEWADIHWIKLWAMTQDSAKQRIMQRYPGEKGFVITDIIELSE